MKVLKYILRVLGMFTVGAVIILAAIFVLSILMKLGLSWCVGVILGGAAVWWVVNRGNGD